MHVRCTSLYISLPSSAKQQREMTKFCCVYETWTTPANFSHFHLGYNAVVTYGEGRKGGGVGGGGVVHGSRELKSKIHGSRELK